MRLKIGSLVIGGMGGLRDIPLIDISERGTYVTFPEGSCVVPGEVYQMVAPVGFRRGARLPLTCMRHIVASFRVVAVAAKTRALVRVLRGSVARGFCAEKLGVSFSREGPRPSTVESSPEFLYSSPYRAHGADAKHRRAQA